jgi:TolB-like protein/Tfp pilus assembly protein PilF
LYVAGAWGFLQGLEYVSESFNWPQQLRQIALLALVIGLPIVLVLAWFHGDRGEQRLRGSEVAIITFLFVLGGGIFWRYERASETATAPSASQTTSTTATDASIAVLPFVNMSTDKEQEYFADGIAEELLNLLAQVPELRVIARTSSFSFKGKNLDIAEIARRLNVANVLEGSVRRSGDRLRITAQLIRASDSSHLWSQTYDRQMTDVFEVQDEIAAVVVEQLKIKLLGAVPTVRKTDPQAYALYMQAVQLGRQFKTEGLKRSHVMLQQVVAIDPRYAPAWNELARSFLRQNGAGLLPNDESYGGAREAAEKALAIDPTYAAAHAMLGTIAGDTGDLAGAVRHCERALALAPADLEVLRNVSYLLQTVGRLNESIALDEAVAALDPVNPSVLNNLGNAYRKAGRFDEAIARLRTTLSLVPGREVAHYLIGTTLLLKGEPEAALPEMQAETNELGRMLGLPMVYHALGKKAESDAALAKLIAKYGKELSYNIASIYAMRGDVDQAFEWLDTAVQNDDPGFTEILVEPLFNNIKQDPRWLPLLHKLGLAPEQLAAIKFDVALPENASVTRQ